MRIVSEPISLEELKRIASSIFGNMVKAVVDVDRGLLALDAELHADLEALLLDHGSKQRNLWGINFYPDLSGDDFIEYDSMINVRPAQGNRSRSVSDPKIREKISQIVGQWIRR